MFQIQYRKKYPNDIVATRYILNGELHNEDGPALEYLKGDRLWYNKGLLHREDGPAIEFADGREAWYLKDVCYNKIRWQKLVETCSK